MILPRFLSLLLLGGALAAHPNSVSLDVDTSVVTDAQPIDAGWDRAPDIWDWRYLA